LAALGSDEGEEPFTNEDDDAGTDGAEEDPSGDDDDVIEGLDPDGSTGGDGGDDPNGNP
ncbi:MAG: hypothetical protein IID40_01740, partial [Planctomycetes bacterium]|nr:hypothetical protein [Planctomycetota bacterium]